MPHIMPHVIPGVDPATHPALAEIERQTGPNNFLRLMAHRPEALQDFFRFHQTVMNTTGTIEQRLKEILYLAVSTVNECDRCTHYHHRSGERAGLTAKEINEIATEQNQNFSVHERTALMYARELTRTASVSGDLRYKLQEYYSPAQCVEITMVIGLANFTNRFNNGLAVAPD